MKNFLTLGMLFLGILSFHQLNAQVAINEISADGQVEIINNGTDAVDISAYWLCDRPFYEQFQNLTVSCGSLMLGANETVVVQMSSIDVNPDGDELAIYTSSSFGSSTAIEDYVIWGNRMGSTREPVAVSAGIWTSDERAPAFSDTETLNWDGQGDNAAAWSTASPSICDAGGGDCTVVGGTLTGGPFTFCAGDGTADNIAEDGITLEGNSGSNSQWVVTDEQGNILGLPPTFSAVDFDGAGAGTCLVWHLSFEDGLTGAEMGANADDLQGCFSLSNPITVVRYQPVGGTLTGGPFTFCVGDGTADNIAEDGITLEGNSGSNSQWVVTDEQGNILGLPPTFAAVDFDGAGAGTCLVWHLSFEDGLTGAEVGANAGDLEGCFSLSNPITVIRNQPVGGTLTGGPFTFCAGDGTADNIAEDGITLEGNSGSNSQWVVTDEQGNILGLPPTFSAVDFDGAGVGTCLVWHLSFEDGLTGAEMGANADNLQGCFSLSNPISVVRTDDAEVCGTTGGDCTVVGGTLTGGPFTFCAGDGTADNIAEDGITLEGNSGPNSQWVVTDEEGNILGLPPTFSAVDFDGAGAGTCLVWHLSFEDGLTGAEMGANADNLQGCFSLSNPITVVRNQPIGGTLTGGPFTFCAGDGIADNIAEDGITLEGNSGSNSQWVVTDEQGNILGLPPTFSAVDFDGAGVGTCLVWHLSFEDGLTGAEMGANADDLQGCFSLSNPISVVRTDDADVCGSTGGGDCNVEGGLLTGGPFTFCVGDGEADNLPEDAIGLFNNSGPNSQWVVTDISGNILGLPPTFSAVDFDGAGVGTCLVWHLSFEDGLTGAEVGANADDLQGCFSLSNPVAVERTDAAEVCGTTGGDCNVVGGLLTGGPFTFCAGDGEADNIPSDAIGLFNNVGPNSQWVITDINGNILGLPPTFSAVDFDGAGVGTCLVWHLSFEDGLTGAEMGANADDLQGCFSLSNPVAVERTDAAEVCGTTGDCTAEGGLLTGGPFSFCAGDGEADNIDADDITLSGNSGTNSQWVVTDLDGNILGLPPTFSAVNFDGAGAGTCLVWHLSFEDGLTGAEMGANANDLQGCFSLSNPVSVVRSQPEGGTLTGGPFAFCVGDGEADNIDADDITLSGSSGSNSQWVVTDEEGNILGLPPTFSAVDFDGAGAGTCLVWHLSFEDGLTGAEMGANANDLEGCFSLSNPISVVRYQPEGGTLKGGPFEFCVGDGDADNIAADDITLSGNSGSNSQWVVTDEEGNILGLPPTFSAVNFDGAGVGTCLVWHLSFEDGLEGAEMGANANDLQGCFSLSNPISVVRIDCGGCNVSGGSLTGGPFEFCVGDGNADNIAEDEISLIGNSGSNSQWVVTDEEGNILGLPPTFSAVNFDGAGAGTCLVWHLSFEDGLEGAEMGANANDLQGCFSLSNPISVVRYQPEGGTLTGGPFEFCVGDNVADNIPADAISLSDYAGSNTQWVVTDEEGNILGLPPTFSAVNFDGAGPGTCLVWHLSFEDGLQGAEVGMNANDLEGCFSLSNPISVYRSDAANVCNTDCDVDGGTINTPLGRTALTICAGDGLPNPFSVRVKGATEDSRLVITDEEGEILGLPDGYTVDLDGAGPGVCLVWNIAYDETIGGLEVGNNTSDLTGCYSLSNPITVTRLDCDPNVCQTPLNLTAQRRSNSSYLIRWDRVSGHVRGYEVVIGFKGEDRSFVTIPTRRNRLTLSSPSTKTIVIKVRTICRSTGVSDFTEYIEINPSQGASAFGRDSFKGDTYGAFTVGTSEFALAPNPASDFVNVNVNSSEVTGQIEIYDVAGRRVANHILEAGAISKRIELSELQNGMYIMMIKSDGVIIDQQRFVIAK